MGRLAVVVVLALVAWQLAHTGAWRATAQGTEAQVVIERPLVGTTVSTQLLVSGWAVDPAGPGTGVDAVHVYLDGEPGMPRARFLGPASYGHPRPDVARALGDARFTNSGFSLLVEVSPGTHSLYVYAHSANAGPQEGWTRASVHTFETSVLVPGPTMVQPGPGATGDSGRYQTGPATWEGGGTCLRYTGAGTCAYSVPYSVVTGAACIQWNQRGQCVSYLPAEGATVGGAGGSPGGRSTVGTPAPLSVPTVAVASAPIAPVVPAPRAVAPPPPPPSEEAPAEDTPEASEPADAEVPPPAAPAAPPPEALTAPPPEEAASPPRAVRVAAPPAPAAAPAGSPPPAAPGPEPAGPAAGPSPTAIVIVTARQDTAITTSNAGDPVPLYDDAPPAAAPPPQVAATQAALLASSGQSSGVAPLRSGCALYLGCGPESGPPTPVAAGRAAAPATGSATGPGPALVATPTVVAPLAPTAIPMPLLPAGPMAPGGAPATPTATPCPPFTACPSR
jgi:hypothetical protein